MDSPFGSIELRGACENNLMSYTVGALWFRQCRHLDSHPFEHGDPPAHGDVGPRPDQKQAYQGGNYGWQRFFAALEQVLARID
jgi:hypothetical protein